MSRENVEIVRSLGQVVEGDGWEAALTVAEEMCDADLEWVEDPSWPGSDTYTGLPAVRALLAERHDTFDFDQHTERLIDAGDEVVALLRWRGRGHASGAEVELRLATVTTLRAGKITRVRFYLDPSEALKAVGREG